MSAVANDILLEGELILAVKTDGGGLIVIGDPDSPIPPITIDTAHPCWATTEEIREFVAKAVAKFMLRMEDQ